VRRLPWKGTQFRIFRSLQLLKDTVAEHHSSNEQEQHTARSSAKPSHCSINRGKLITKENIHRAPKLEQPHKFEQVINFKPLAKRHWANVLARTDTDIR
jgi:hypothetical protein